MSKRRATEDLTRPPASGTMNRSADTLPGSRRKEMLLFVLTREYKRMKAELARIKQETKYVRLAGVTADVLAAEPDALYWVADFGQGWSKGKGLYLYFSPEKFGRRDYLCYGYDNKLAWFVRRFQEKPSPQFDDHDHIYGVDSYKWVSVPRVDLGWRVELAIDEDEIAFHRAENARRPP